MLVSPITFLTGQGVGRFSFLQEWRQTVPTPPVYHFWWQQYSTKPLFLQINFTK
jgi:hypothetical protein